jgi:hypothetical protein
MNGAPIESPPEGAIYPSPYHCSPSSLSPGEREEGEGKSTLPKTKIRWIDLGTRRTG